MNLPGYEWLMRKHESEEGQKRIETVKQLTGIAQDLGISTTHLALAWCLKNPHVSSVILGASRLEQLKDNLLAMSQVPKMPSYVMTRIEAVIAG
ncbi:MAG: aldo/keto reductase, partial [Gammaproteobacteria bacterium]